MRRPGLLCTNGGDTVGPDACAFTGPLHHRVGPPRCPDIALLSFARGDRTCVGFGLDLALRPVGSLITVEIVGKRRGVGAATAMTCTSLAVGRTALKECAMHGPAPRRLCTSRGCWLLKRKAMASSNCGGA